MSILVTGGAGFIGSNFLHRLLDVGYDDIICVDKFTYAADNRNVPASIKTYVADISDKHCCEFIFKKHKPDVVFNFAAETHVDNSIKDCSEFIHTNILGTVNLLNLSLNYDIGRFIHVSTDEVYGSILEGSFIEESKYNPRNPYSASKASSDHFVSAYYHTYGLPTIITNCSNNYGPRQNVEKLIPKAITNLLFGKKVPVYGKGEQVRDWLFVKDHCDALVQVYEEGGVGEKYNIGGECEFANVDLIRIILDIMGFDESMIEYVQDRPGHDFRYSTNISKIYTDIGWEPKYNLKQGLEETINWYERNWN